jgi:hypothetical protein
MSLAAGAIQIRRVKIEMHGVRNGWEPFGQWSMQQAQELARQETDRINGSRRGPAPSDLFCDIVLSVTR